MCHQSRRTIRMDFSHLSTGFPNSLSSNPSQWLNLNSFRWLNLKVSLKQSALLLGEFLLFSVCEIFPVGETWGPWKVAAISSTSDNRTRSPSRSQGDSFILFLCTSFLFMIRSLSVSNWSVISFHRCRIDFVRESASFCAEEHKLLHVWRKWSGSENY